MRATSLPTALPIATAAVALVAAVLAPLAVPCSALAKRWLRPVSGEVARSFSYARAAPFVRGAHRGVDLAAPPGTAVRAACAGRVVHAGPVPGSDEVVSMRCGARRVSYLPLATVAVRAGATIKARTALGTVAPGHGGLHLGVRRESDRFGYEDPMTLLPRPERPFTPAPRVKPPGAAPRRARPRPAPRPSTPRAAPRPAIPSALAWSTAPWPVWAGLALLLLGAAGSGTIAVRRRRVARARAPLAVETT
jgi:murein DD-endopeptidase MepM/ murein hydrolase activator NlpD